MSAMNLIIYLFFDHTKSIQCVLTNYFRTVKEQKKLHLYEFTVQRERRKKITHGYIVSILTANYLIFTQKNSNKVLKSPVVKLLFVNDT